MRKIINICLASDNYYAEHMYVTVFSLLYNLNKSTFCNVYILDSKLKNSVYGLFYGLEKKFSNCKIFFIKVDESKYYKYLSLGGTYQTYFRIDIPYLLPKLSKILYLDPDIVVDGDITGIYDIEMNGYAIGAPTCGYTFKYYEETLKIPVSKYGYFCAGVLLMNLDYMRKHESSDLIYKFLDEKNGFVVYDQEGLNGVLYNKRKNIPLEYSVDQYVFTRNRKYFRLHKPIIIHYGGSKPWNKYCINSLSLRYHYYRGLSGLHPVQYGNKLELRRLFNNLKIYIVSRLCIFYQKFIDTFIKKKSVIN